MLKHAGLCRSDSQFTTCPSNYCELLWRECKKTLALVSAPVSPGFENFEDHPRCQVWAIAAEIFENPQNAHNLHVGVFNQMQKALLNKIANL